MVSRCPEIFDDEFKQFYCHYNEPWHVKDAKLDILPALTNESNVTPLVQELSEYVGDINQEVSKKALKAIGRMAVRIPASADSIINILLEFIEMDVDYVR
jgi:AP-2 complex subunit beta-1